MLQAIAGQAGIEIDFEDSSFSGDSEYENEEEEEEEAEGDGENKKEEQEEKEEEEKGEEGEEGGEKVAGGKEKVEGRVDKEAKEEGEGKDNTGNCGADGSSGARSRENEHTNGLHGNTKTSLTSSEQVPDDSPNKSRPPLHQDSLPVSVRRVNGVADDVTVHNSQQGGSGNAQSPHSHGDSNPCDRDSSPRGYDKSPCDRDSSPRAAATTQSSTQEPSRNHTLLGLLTSAVSSPHNHRVSIGSYVLIRNDASSTYPLSKDTTKIRTFSFSQLITIPHIFCPIVLLYVSSLLTPPLIYELLLRVCRRVWE